MPVASEPIPIAQGINNREFYYNEQLSRLFMMLQNLTLTQDQKKAIANGDKAGNFDAKYLVVTSSGTANNENTWAHGLKRVPQGYIVVRADKACDVYDGTTPWTTTNIYLKVSVATVALTILVF